MRCCYVAVALIALGTPCLGYAQETGRLVDCRLEGARGKVEFVGKCRLLRERGGSFTLENVDRKQPLFDTVVSVSVSIISPGIAQVRGLTSGGINARGEPARRSKNERTCWVGKDFKVCAR